MWFVSFGIFQLLPYGRKGGDKKNVAALLMRTFCLPCNNFSNVLCSIVFFFFVFGVPRDLCLKGFLNI